MFTDFDEDKMRRTDRILVLKPVEGKSSKSSTGLVDPRLFKGENSLHVVMDPSSCLWSFKYEQGGLPFPLRDVSFTSFGKALNHAKEYFKSRNVEIVEIKD